MGSVGKQVEQVGQGVGSFFGINSPSQLGRGGTFQLTPEAAAAEKEAIQRLRAQAAGEGPSVTELQYKQALDESIRQQQAAVASARGVSNVGLLQRQAMVGGQQAGLDIARESAAAKIQEQRSAQQALLNQAAAQRGVAAQAAGAELQAQQQAGQTRAGFFGSLAGAGASMMMGGKGKYAGGEVEGEAQVPGDSPENDTEPHMLSPGEIVIPRTAAKDRESAMAFLDALKFANEKSDKPKSEQSYKEQEGDYFNYAKGMATLLEAMAQLHKKKGE